MGVIGCFHTTKDKACDILILPAHVSPDESEAPALATLSKILMEEDPLQPYNTARFSQ